MLRLVRIAVTMILRTASPKKPAKRRCEIPALIMSTHLFYTVLQNVHEIALFRQATAGGGKTFRAIGMGPKKGNNKRSHFVET